MDLPPTEGPRVSRANAYLAESLQRSASAVAGVQAMLERRENERIARVVEDLKARAEQLQSYLQRLSPGSSRSSALAVGKAVDLDPSSSRAMLTSSEAVNTDTRAAAPSAPLWSGDSTAQPTISGNYDRSLATTSLTFTVTRDGEHGSDDVRVQVTDDNSEYSERINVRARDNLDKRYRLDSRIGVEFSGGQFELNDTFSVNLQVDDAVKPDPAGAFDASGGTDANLEEGLNVGAGTFTVNGELITVDADDSILSVIAKINVSDAGVVAAYDPDAELFTLEQQDSGRVPTIEVGNDSSGFLEAMKLDSDAVVPGVDPDLRAPIAEVASLSGVQSGSVLVNGVSIALDVTRDSISSVLRAINESEAGVRAKLSLNAFASIRQLGAGELSLDSNGTNLFEAFGITRQRFSAKAATRSADSRLFEVSRQTQDLVDTMNKLFETAGSRPLTQEIADLRAQLGQLIDSEIRKPLAKLGLRTGLRFALQTDRDAFADLNSAELRRGLRWRFNDVQTIFTDGRSSGSGGALRQLVELLDQAVLNPVERGKEIDEIV